MGVITKEEVLDYLIPPKYQGIAVNFLMVWFAVIWGGATMYLLYKGLRQWMSHLVAEANEYKAQQSTEQKSKRKVQ